MVSAKMRKPATGSASMRNFRMKYACAGVLQLPQPWTEYACGAAVLTTGYAYVAALVLTNTLGLAVLPVRKLGKDNRISWQEPTQVWRRTPARLFHEFSGCRIDGECRAAWEVEVQL